MVLGTHSPDLKKISGLPSEGNRNLCIPASWSLQIGCKQRRQSRGSSEWEDKMDFMLATIRVLMFPERSGL